MPLLPGEATLGVLGGGQLGRMFVHAAQALGYRCVVLDPDAASPAGAGDDRPQAAAFGLLGIGEHLVGHAVGGNHPRLERHAELGENVGGVLHGLPVTAGAHDHADDGGDVGSGGAAHGSVLDLSNRETLNCRRAASDAVLAVPGVRRLPSGRRGPPAARLLPSLPPP